MKITESQLKNATSTFYECEAVGDLMSMRAAIESLDIEIISDPKTITINGVEVPGPERVAPTIGTDYYAIELTSVPKYTNLTWANDSTDRRYLELGLVYRTEKDCLATANAIINALKEKP